MFTVVCTCWLNSTHVIVDINANVSSFLNNITYYSHFCTRCSLLIIISQKSNKGHEICPVVWLDCVTHTLFCHRLSVIEHNSYITIFTKKSACIERCILGIISGIPEVFRIFISLDFFSLSGKSRDLKNKIYVLNIRLTNFLS